MCTASFFCSSPIPPPALTFPMFNMGLPPPLPFDLYLPILEVGHHVFVPSWAKSWNKPHRVCSGYWNTGNGSRDRLPYYLMFVLTYIIHENHKNCHGLLKTFYYIVFCILEPLCFILCLPFSAIHMWEHRSEVLLAHQLYWGVYILYVCVCIWVRGEEGVVVVVLYS